MSTTTASPSFSARPLTLPLRAVMLVVALAAVAASFAIGHTTAGHRTQVVHQVITPSAPAPANHSSCNFRVGIPC